MLFPPPRLILGAATGERATALQHVLIVRFPARSLDAVYGVARPDAVLARRLELFKTWTLPSLEQLSAADAAWFVLPEPDLPERVVDELVACAGDRVLVPDDQDQRLDPGAQAVAVAWVVAGDAVHPGVCAAVERHAAAALEADEPFGIEFAFAVEATAGRALLVQEPPPRSFFVLVAPGEASVNLADPRHPRLRLASLAHLVTEWGVAALLRARPGPNEHPLFLRERGPDVAPELLSVFGTRSIGGAAEPATAGAGGA
jgi:hypothetical protein